MMKKSISRLVSLSLVFLLAFSAAPAAFSAPAENKGIKYTPIAEENGVPVETLVHRDPVTKELYYTYTGRKRITCNFSTPNVSIRAASENGLRVWTWENYLTVENVSLRPGDSATVTVTATHKDYAPVIQKVKITVTTGSVGYPHLIAEGNDLLSISALGLNKSYKQTADIDIGRITKWTPVGSENSPFTGTYDGGGYKITNMNFNDVESDYNSLFGRVFGKTASIKGIRLEGKINPTLMPILYSGAIIGKLEAGTVSDCSFKGDMTLRGSAITAGGIVGAVIGGGKVQNCSFDGKMSASVGADARIGGIAGLLEGTAENCVFTGKLVCEGAEVTLGGIAGVNRGGISNSAAKADIEKYGRDGILGGIVGENYSTIHSSAFSGAIYSKGANVKMGGITGNNTGIITDAAVKGSIRFFEDYAYAGGIAGRNIGGTIQSSACEAEIYGDSFGAFAGGIAGDNYSYIDARSTGRSGASLATITGCSFKGSVKINGGNSASGGIAGINCGYTLTDSKTQKNAQSLIENCVVRATSIIGKKAGRITSENLSYPKGYVSSEVHPVILSNNAALKSALVNEKAASDKTTGSDINGLSMSETELAAFETKNVKTPSALELIK